MIYKVTVDGHVIANGVDLDGDSQLRADRSVVLACKALAMCPAGKRATVTRRRWASTEWVPYRAYVVNANGIVERTDR